MRLLLGLPRLLAQVEIRLRNDDIQIVWELSSFSCTHLLLGFLDQQLRTCSIKASEMLAAIDKSRRNVLHQAMTSSAGVGALVEGCWQNLPLEAVCCGGIKSAAQSLTFIRQSEQDMLSILRGRLSFRSVLSRRITPRSRYYDIYLR